MNFIVQNVKEEIKNDVNNEVMDYVPVSKQTQSSSISFLKINL